MFTGLGNCEIPLILSGSAAMQAAIGSRLVILAITSLGRYDVVQWTLPELVQLAEIDAHSPFGLMNDSKSIRLLTLR